MARRIVEAGGLLYNFSADDEIPAEGRTRAFLRGRVIDELTGAPPLETITVESDMDFSFPRVVDGGIAGLVGIPREIFPPLAMKNYVTRLTVRAPGYIPHQSDVTIPTDQRTIAAPTPVPPYEVIALNDLTGLRVGQTLLVGPVGPTLAVVRIAALDFGANQITVKPKLTQAYAAGDPVIVVVPDDFVAADAGTVEIHREPIVIRGRIVLANGNTITRISGATVRIACIWRTLPPAHLVVPVNPPIVVVLEPHLYFARIVATGRLKRIEMMPVVGEDKQLLSDVLQGNSLLSLSDGINLGVGNIIAIDAARPGLQEFLTVGTVSTAPAGQPVDVTLTYPVAHPHRVGAVVRKVTPQAPGADNQLSQDALADDACVYLQSKDGLNAADIVEITGGGNPVEYHRLSHFSTAVVSLRPPLYLARSAAAGRLRRREMPAVMGDDKHLLDAVSKGNDRIKLSNRNNLSSGDTILLDADSADLMEYLTIHTVTGASTTDQPAVVILTHPLSYSHRRGVVARKVTPQAPGADNQFGYDAIAGDTCVFLTSLNDLDPANVVEIFDGINPAEYHRVSRFSTTSDANGYFRLPPLSRVAQIEVHADDAGPPARTITQIFSPNYSQRENRLDLVLR